MSSFEESIKSKTLSAGKNDPAATDLDYYSKPENYTGSNLASLQKFKADKTKEEKTSSGNEKKKVIKDAKYHFFHRYKHLLQGAIFLKDLEENEAEEESDEEEEDDIEAEGDSAEVDKDKESRPTTDSNLQTITEEGSECDDRLEEEEGIEAEGQSAEVDKDKESRPTTDSNLQTITEEGSECADRLEEEEGFEAEGESVEVDKDKESRPTTDSNLQTITEEGSECDDRLEEEEIEAEGESVEVDKDKESRPTTDSNLQTITEEGSECDDRLERKSRQSAEIFSCDHSTSTSNQDDVNQSLDSGVSGMSISGSAKRKATSSGRQSTAIQRMQMDKVSREIRARELKTKFVKAVKGVKAIVRLSASARGKAEMLRRSSGDMSSMRTFMDIADEGTSTNENMKNAGLSFDPSYFKAKKEISLSTETKNILTTPSEQRTPEQVQTAMFGLQCLRSFAEYPLHMQEKLAKVAWYEVVAPKRIIIRQGHFAENFYFILSGHAVVTILLRNPQTGASFVKTATVMKKGMSFGELALLHHSKRTATVTSQDQVQLLSIGREDFFDIFMSCEGPDNMPEHIRFISNLDFMKDWPIQELIDHPEFCLLHFFKRNTTIVANSNQSEWMYIVKSGSCQVLKKLKGVTAKSYSAKPKVDDICIDPKLKAVVFVAKVQTGLRKRPKSIEDEDSDAETESKNSAASSDKDKHVKFSKETYSENPDTKKAHFSADSSFSKRKHYEPPPKCRPKKTEVPKEETVTLKPGPVFVQVSTMKPRDIFGLESIEFDDDISRSHTSVSLVSRGAECIMLSKEFYVKHANEAVKKRVREFVRPYPDEHVFQDNLQIKEDWVMYKRVMLNDLTSQLVDRSSRFYS